VAYPAPPYLFFFMLQTGLFGEKGCASGTGRFPFGQPFYGWFYIRLPAVVYLILIFVVPRDSIFSVEIQCINARILTCTLDRESRCTLFSPLAETLVSTCPPHTRHFNDRCEAFVSGRELWVYPTEVRFLGPASRRFAPPSFYRSAERDRPASHAYVGSEI